MTELEIAQMAVRLYAESRPRPSQVTQTQAAEMLGLSRPTVSKMVKSGYIKLNSLIFFEFFAEFLIKRKNVKTSSTQARGTNTPLSARIPESHGERMGS